MKSILDRSFEYTPAAKTDLRKTFARIRREQRAREFEEAKASAAVSEKVKTLHPGRRAGRPIVQGEER